MFNFYKNALSGVLTDPLCADFKNEWRAIGDDKERLVALSLRQQSIPYFATHCAERKGLTKKFILSNFDNYINGYTIKNADGVEGHTYGLYVGWDFDNDIVCEQDVIHVMWSDATVTVPKTKCPTIYVSNGSHVDIVCEGYNSIRLYVFDKSSVTIEDSDDTCEITAYEYSDKCRAEKGRFCLSENFKTHKKELRL